ncbi:hypothetical protein N6H14_28830 [Paenibacillus sp. CC-CFT747]|nr:hypothetical protein N6H14_28830 [Paenibacillus sp. CC-CFT747]
MSTAAILPFSPLGRRSKQGFRFVYTALAFYSYGAETIQNVRGVNPRFVRDGSGWDQAVGAGFALVAMLLVVFYVALAVSYFRRNAFRKGEGMIVAIRYAMAAVILSFAAGIWISVNQGRYTGDHGNIIWLHGLGFHALQALPFAAWLAGRVPQPFRTSGKWIHLAGITYLLGLDLIAVQTINGAPVLEWSAFPLAACLCFAVSLGMGALLLVKACRTNGGARAALLP